MYIPGYVEVLDLALLFPYSLLQLGHLRPSAYSLLHLFHLDDSSSHLTHRLVRPRLFQY